MTLEALILKAIAEGRFGGLSLWAAPGGFQANVKSAQTGGWRCETGADPIAQLRLALGEAPAKGSVFD